MLQGTVLKLKMSFFCGKAAQPRLQSKHLAVQELHLMPCEHPLTIPGIAALWEYVMTSLHYSQVHCFIGQPRQLSI